MASRIALPRGSDPQCAGDGGRDGLLVAADWGLEIPAAPERWNARAHGAVDRSEEADAAPGINLALLIVLGVACWIVIVLFGAALVSWW